jgi:hypothetical protein
MSGDERLDVDFPQYLLAVNVTVDPAIEEDWNRWYDQVHLPEIASCPGFGSAARYVTADDPRLYLTLYALSDPAAVAGGEFSKRRGWGRFADRVDSNLHVYRRHILLPARRDGR